MTTTETAPPGDRFAGGAERWRCLGESAELAGGGGTRAFPDRPHGATQHETAASALLRRRARLRQQVDRNSKRRRTSCAIETSPSRCVVNAGPVRSCGESAARSDRCTREPFVTNQLRALPADVLESELFAPRVGRGDKDREFVELVHRRKPSAVGALLVNAWDGTLFLHEFGELRFSALGVIVNPFERRRFSGAP